ncbi:TonB-dependent siderophore receptor [Sandaracinobacter sp. RS1-74]|uniref:TonB-dependent siderophore receptor n=1 Tax=Sandaracinobacteroides sayramensis TaxID=2913411 RepID=UPI001EDAAAD1|nr:TonB-dependent siderophore receptor [Sandaracinobacteroides sayramensis]MCG2842626.1 TonB-dependent siderophore receptor [Sandaracinobacteroides sayramensis]
MAALLAGVALVGPAVAHAQEAEAAASDEGVGIETVRQDDGAIVVTARRFVPQGAITASKTTAPLIETPQSVSVISRDQIDLLNFVDVQQAVRYTAGIVGENYGPDMRFDFLTLRGFIPDQYIDGLRAPISATIANVGAELYGFEAVDILKGPSGVLYGTTPPGGIYNLTSRRPSTRTGGEVQVKYGTDDFKQAAGTVTGEIANGLSARLTGLYRDRDGQTDHVTAKRAYVAPAVSYELGMDTKITGLGFYQWDKIEGDTNGFLPALGVLFPNPVGRVPRGVNLGEPDYNFYRRRQWSAGYELTHRFSSALRFTQNLRWSEYHEYQQIIYGTALDADNRTVYRANYPYQDDVAQFAVDSRFDGNLETGIVEHRFLVGLDYRNYRETAAFAFDMNVPTIDLFNPVYSQAPIAVPELNTIFSDQRLRQTGLYVQDQAKVGDFILTLSARHDWTRISDYTKDLEKKQNKFTWRAGLTYVDDASGIAPYLSYGTSFQPVVGATFAGEAFSPTSGRQWEAGVKYDARGLGDDIRLFATAAVFHIRQSNVVTDDPDQVNRPGGKVQTGEVESKGFELELVTRIREQLSVNASYSYTDARITESNIVLEQDARLPAQPRHKASLFVDYTKSTGTLAGAGGGLGIRHLSETPGNIPSVWTPDVYTSPGVTLFDAALHYSIPGWRFGVNGSNIFDKRYAGRCTGPMGCFFGQARQVTATVTKTF